MNYLHTSETHPLMGLDNELCLYPKYWCPLHKVWLSEKDVSKKQCKNKPFGLEYKRCSKLVENDERLKDIEILAKQYRDKYPGLDSVPIRSALTIRGIPLKNKFCNGYNFYTWEHPEDKPDYDSIKVQYCYITVKPSIFVNEYKLQVMIDHETKTVYFHTALLHPAFLEAAMQEISNIIQGIENESS